MFLLSQMSCSFKCGVEGRPPSQLISYSTPLARYLVFIDDVNHYTSSK